MEAAPEGWNAEQFAVRHLATYMERFATWQTSDDNHGSPTSGQHRANSYGKPQPVRFVVGHSSDPSVVGS
jgi:hypothetical protein